MKQNTATLKIGLSLKSLKIEGQPNDVPLKKLENCSFEDINISFSMSFFRGNKVSAMMKILKAQTNLKEPSRTNLLLDEFDDIFDGKWKQNSF